MDRPLALKDVDQLAGVLAQVRIGVRVCGDAIEQQRGQFGGARAAGGHVAGEMGEGAGDQVGGSSFA